MITGYGVEVFNGTHYIIAEVFEPRGGRRLHHCWKLAIEHADKIGGIVLPMGMLTETECKAELKRWMT